MLFLPETLSGPLLVKTLNPMPQVLGAAGKKKTDFKPVPSIMSYWEKFKRLLDPGFFNKTFSFSSSEILQTGFSDSSNIFPSQNR